MLRRQRNFFLTSNQYEPVLLEYVGVRSNRLWYRFKVFDDAERYYANWRQSTDGGNTWTDWSETQEFDIHHEQDGYVYLSYGSSAGLMYETSVVVTGDDKDPSDESNIVTTIYPHEPAQPIPYINVYPFFYNGRPYPFIMPDEMPAGVSSFMVWQREFGDTEWEVLGHINSWSALVRRGSTPEWTEPGKKYQYIIAWYDSVNNYILSDISNVGTVELPEANIEYLLPLIPTSATFVDVAGQGYGADYYNLLQFARGDMRNEGYRGRARRSSDNVWITLPDVEVNPGNINSYTDYMYWAFGGDVQPIEGEVWEYQFKNYAEGFEDSEWSEIFTITIPSILPRLTTPTIILYQAAMYVVINWSSVSDAAGYKIERRSSLESSWTVLQASLSSSVTSYEDRTTSYGNTYYYRVTALADNITYQDSNPAQASISVVEVVKLNAPVISNIAESGASITMTVSNIDAYHTYNVEIEMSENNGAWSVVYVGNPHSQSETSFNATIDYYKILEGGNLRYRAKAYSYPNSQIESSDYSEIESITIDEREWLLRWTGSAWDYCTSVTGGWYSPAITDSEHTTPSGAIVPQDQGNGVLRLCGANNSLVEGWYMTQANLTGPNTSLRSKYKKICVIGSLIKSQAGTTYHAWFGSAYTYTFSGGVNVDTGGGTRVIAGSDSGPGYAGTLTDPEVTACGVSNKATAIGSHVFFYFDGGYADIKGIYAIKQ